MIYMSVCESKGRWYANVTVKDCGGFVVIRKTRNQAWKDAWRQVIAIFNVMDVAAECVSNSQTGRNRT